MSTLAIARLFGLCVTVVGFCILTIGGIGFFDALALLLNMLIAAWKVGWYVIGFAVTFIGFIWVIRPQRVLDTVARNQARRGAKSA